MSPFTLAEIKKAAGLLDRSSAPGPDGLGPAFYQAAWETVSVDLLQLFDAFFDGSVDLEPINRAYIALLPKGSGATPTPS